MRQTQKFICASFSVTHAFIGMNFNEEWISSLWRLKWKLTFFYQRRYNTALDSDLFHKVVYKSKYQEIYIHEIFLTRSFPCRTLIRNTWLYCFQHKSCLKPIHFIENVMLTVFNYKALTIITGDHFYMTC